MIVLALAVMVVPILVEDAEVAVLAVAMVTVMVDVKALVLLLAATKDVPEDVVPVA